jgi:hypothetical protein
MAQIGGMAETFTATLAILIFPYSRQSFVLKGIKKIFLKRLINEEKILD